MYGTFRMRLSKAAESCIEQQQLMYCRLAGSLLQDSGLHASVTLSGKSKISLATVSHCCNSRRTASTYKLSCLFMGSRSPYKPPMVIALRFGSDVPKSRRASTGTHEAITCRRCSLGHKEPKLLRAASQQQPLKLSVCRFGTASAIMLNDFLSTLTNPATRQGADD